MVTLTIDGQQVQGEKGVMILDVAKANDIYIPSLCAHEGVTPYGACRLCLVEVIKNTKKRLVASCLYPVEEGLVVTTNSERIANNRKVLMELLLARCPDSDIIQVLAKRLSVEKTPFALEDHKKCILCALCVRACFEVVGISAISFINRGINREVATPFCKSSDTCIGCGSCAYICPTHAITMKDTGAKRVVKWPHNQMEFKLKKCKVCGTYWAPEKQIEHIAKISGTSPQEQDICPDCRD